jgi:Transposase DDE domain
MMRYRASKLDCQNCPLKPQCCPNTPARKIPRSIHEGARDLARDIAKTEAYRTSRCQRKKVEMLFAHLKRILKLDRLRLRGPNGARDELHLAATAQNLRKLAILVPAARCANLRRSQPAFAATADGEGWSRSLHRRVEVLIGKCGYRRLLDHDNGAVVGPVADIARRCQLLVSRSELIAVLGLDCSAKCP